MPIRCTILPITLPPPAHHWRCGPGVGAYAQSVGRVLVGVAGGGHGC